MAGKYVEGNSIRVSVGEDLLGGQTDCTLNRNTETSDTTTKDSGMWSEEEVVGLSWSADCSGFVANGDTGYEGLKTAWRAGTQVDIKYGTPAKYETGKAIIESLSENSPAKEKTTYSVTLKGVGELKEGTGTVKEG